MDEENERTLYVGNLAEQVKEEHLWELFLQSGPLQRVKIPCDKDGSNKKCFGFVTFKHAVSVPYTISLMDGMRLFGRTLRLQNRSGGNSRPQTQSTPINQQHQHPMRSFSAPFPHVDYSGMMPGLMGMVPQHPMMDAGQAAVLNQLLPMTPLMLPPPIGQFDRNAPLDQGSSKGYNDRGSRHQHQQRRSHESRQSHRYEPRSSRDSHSDSNRDRGNSRDRDRDGRGERGGGRWVAPLSTHTNLNPQQRHMQPSSRRNDWRR